jgi:hypothetical protein
MCSHNMEFLSVLITRKLISAREKILGNCMSGRSMNNLVLQNIYAHACPDQLACNLAAAELM